MGQLVQISFIVPCSFPSVPRETFKSVLNIEHPENSKVTFFVNSVMPLDYNRNDSIERAIHEFKADYVFFGDADQTFPPETLVRLLECCTDEFPVVTGVYYRKTTPHYTVVGKYVPWQDRLEPYRHALRSNGFLTDKGEQCLFFKPVDTIKTFEPFQVDVFGMGCVLIRADVFKKFKQPYFRYVNGYQNGDFTLGRISEDMAFCAALKKAGIKALCNPRVQCGHITNKIITVQDATLIEETDHVQETAEVKS